MNRTSVKTLESLISRLNTELERPLAPYSPKEEEGCQANVGNLYLDKCLTGYQINEMYNESGGVACPFGYERMTAGEMESKLGAILDTIRIVRSSAVPA